MFDQRAFIERVEGANTTEFARLMAFPAYEEEETLRVQLGEDCFQRLHAASLLVAAPEAQRGVARLAGPARSPDFTSAGECRAPARYDGKRAVNDRDAGGTRESDLAEFAAARAGSA